MVDLIQATFLKSTYFLGSNLCELWISMGSLWPATQFNVAKSQYWKLHFVIRYGQLTDTKNIRCSSQTDGKVPLLKTAAIQLTEYEEDEVVPT